MKQQKIKIDKLNNQFFNPRPEFTTTLESLRSGS